MVLRKLAEFLGNTMGFVLQGKDEKTLYVVSDTVWNKAVDIALEQFQPEVVVMNTGICESQ